MKLLYIITRAEHGGSQSHVAALLEGFQNTLDLTLAVGEEGVLTQQARALGVGVHLLPSLVRPVAPAKDAKAVGEALRCIESVNPDLVHLHTSKAGFVGRVAARRAGVPAVFTAHGWGFAEGVPWRRKGVMLFNEWLTAKWTQKIITVSEADRRLALRHRVVKRDKLETIHNGIADTPQRASPEGGEPVTVVMVARFMPQKDHHLLLEALAGIDPDTYRLLLVGDGPGRPQAEAHARVLGLHNVTFLGTRDDVPDLLARSHVFVLPTKWEGFPISILEAMRAGLPVIASDVGGVREAVGEGETGFLVPRGDAATLRVRLELLLKNPELRARLGAEGRRRFEARFRLERMLDKTYKVYADVLSAGVKK